jgi:hypothetical protein
VLVVDGVEGVGDAAQVADQLLARQAGPAD